MSDLFVKLEILRYAADPWWLIVLVLSLSLHYCAEPTRWYLFCRAEFSLRWRTFFSIFGLTALVTYIFPAKLGLPLRVFLLKKYCGLSLGRITAVVLMDSVLYYGWWAIAAALGFLVGMSFGLRIRWDLVFWGAVLLCGVGGVVYVARALGDSRRSTSTFARNRQHLSDSIASARAALDVSAFLCILCVSVVDIGSHVLRHVALLEILDLDLSLVVIYSITAISVFSGLISFSPLGLGAYDVVLVALLSMNGIPVTDGIVVSILNRVANILFGMAMGVLGGADLGLNVFRRSALSRVVAEASRADEKI